MKKALKIIGIFVVLFIAALIIIPFAFKGKIIALVKEQANKNLKATVDFSDVDLSLIRNFPNLSVSIDDLSVIGQEPFAGDTLVAMKELNLVLDVMSVIGGDQVEIKKILLNEPNINVLVLKDGSANYDITIPSDSTEVPAEEEPGGEVVKLEISEYEIRDGKLAYDDASLEMLLKMIGLNHTGKGNFAEDVFTLFTNTHIDATTVDYGGTVYVNKVETDLKADIAMDLANMKFTFKENELIMNQLALGFDGWLAMPGDDIDMDITFNTKKTELTTIMSLIPAEFASDLDGVDAAGKLDLSGYVKGIYNDTSMPGFGVSMGVENGRVQYPDLPKSIENIQIKADIKSPEGADMNNMTVDVPKFHMELGKSAGQPNTIDARLSLRQPMTDPLIDTKVDADLNLGSFKDVIPMEEDFTLGGILNAHFELKGALSAIENQQFSAFTAGGNAQLASFVYKDAEVAAEIPEARMSFTPQKLDLEILKVIYEGINMQMDGYVDNYVAYALTDTTLHGVFNFTADKIDANKMMGGDSSSAEETESADAETTAPADSTEMLLIPDNLDIILNASIGQILYDDLTIDQMKGQITIKNEIASLKDLAFNLLGGSAKMNGSYNSQNHLQPIADFDYELKQIDIAQTAKAFTTVEKYAPIAKYAQGKVSSTMKLTTAVNADMEPVYETMNGRGSISTDQVVLEGSDFLKKLADTMKSPKLAKQTVQDLNATFVIKDGKITTDPFDVKIDKMKATVSGYTSFDETMDYLMAMTIPRGELGGDFNKMAEGLLGQANKFLGGNMSMGENIKVDVRISGDIADPKITPSFAGMDGANVKDQAKEAVKEAINEKIDEGKEKVKEEASKQAEKIIADAQKQADKIVKDAKDAGDDLRKEADKQAKNLMDEAKNPLSKKGAEIAGNKLKDEADKTAKNLEKEAQKKADDIMKKARDEADKLK